MPRYRYKAYDSAGTLQTGEIAATTRSGALEMLSRRAQYPVEVIESQDQPALKWWQREVLGSSQLSARGLSVFTRELAYLVKANLPLDESLRIVAIQPMLPYRLRRITQSLLERVLEGESLSAAIAREGKTFPEFYVGLIKAGEAGGSLSEVLDDLAGYLERQAESRDKISSALVYPAVLIVAAVIVLVVVATVLLPTLKPIFEEAAGAQPPLLMRVFSRGQALLAREWPVVMALTVMGALGLFALLQNESARLALDRFWLKVPIVGRLITQKETARFSRTFSALVRNGVPILDAVGIGSSVLSNRAFVDAVRRAREEIKEGGTLSAPLMTSGIFPDLFLRLAKVGEQTGQLETMHLRIAEIYESALQRHIDRLTSLITPMLTLVIGGLVGGLILSVMNAILSVNELVLR